MYDVFKELLAKGKVEITRLNSVRVKVHVPCQWTCNFCHMEGNYSSQSIRNDVRFSDALINFRDRFGFSEVHFTGGEPSIHPEITQFIAKAKNLGFKAKMTTNGQAKHSRYFEFINAGLDELNISIHTLDPDELGKIMSPPKGILWGKKAVEKQVKLLDALDGKIPIKINTCVGETENSAIALAEFVRHRSISWRLMNVLEIPELSYASLSRACQILEAQPIQASIINGSSSCSIDMLCKDGFTFKLKLIQSHFLESMCSGCELKTYGGCYEFAYGPRLEVEGGMLMVRNCVHRNGPPFSLPVHSYFSHPIAQQLHEEL